MEKPMKTRVKTLPFRLAMLAAVALITGTLFAQKLSPIKPGFGDSQVLKFSYTQNFDCIDQPKDDLNYNGIRRNPTRENCKLHLRGGYAASITLRQDGSGKYQRATLCLGAHVLGRQRPES